MVDNSPPPTPEARTESQMQADFAELRLVALHRYTGRLKALFALGPGDLEAVEAERERLVASIMLTVSFLKDIDAEFDCGELADRIGKLAAAIFDLRAGIQHPILKPKRKTRGGRNPDRTDVWLARASAAIALHYIMAGGIDERHAAKRIAMSCPELRRLKRSTQYDLEQSIMGWRTQLKDKTADNELAIESYDNEIALLPAIARRRGPEQLQAVGLNLAKGAERQALALLQETELS